MDANIDNVYLCSYVANQGFKKYNNGKYLRLMSFNGFYYLLSSAAGLWV